MKTSGGNMMILGGLLSEAWARFSFSYSKSLDFYNIRVKSGLQPSAPFLNVFDTKYQYTIMIVANCLYILITLFLSLYMKKKKSGYRLRWILVFYDALNVCLAAYVSYSTIMYKFRHGGMLLCNPLSHDLEGSKMATVFALFYLNKYIEFFDTWFFILRKSFRQVTFLHLFHHSSITVVVGSILPFDYNGDMYLPIMLNSFNHMLIYMHYLLATFGVQSLWSPYITALQLTQFCLIFGQSLLAYRIGPTCGSPDFAKILMIVYMGSMVGLVGHFILQKYVFGLPYATLDMCGVIKRPHVLVNTSTQHYGTHVLDDRGQCTILLPEDFPDAQKLAAHSLVFSPFSVVYQLTAVHCAMPNLHVAQEVCRYTPIDRPHNNSTNSCINPTVPVAALRHRASKDSSNTKHQKNNIATNNNSFKTSNPNISNNITNTQTNPIDLVDKDAIMDIDIDMTMEDTTPNTSNNNTFIVNEISKSKPHPSKLILKAKAGMVKAASFSDFQSFSFHNDRLIDGPLPSISIISPLKEARGFVYKCQQQLMEIGSGIVSINSSNRSSRSKLDDNDNDNNDSINNENNNNNDGVNVVNNNDDESFLTSTKIPQSIFNDSIKKSEVVVLPTVTAGAGLSSSRLCFVVAGGVPRGKVSYSVTTVPLPDKRPHTQLQTQQEQLKRDAANQSQDDWRALS